HHSQRRAGRATDKSRSRSPRLAIPSAPSPKQIAVNVQRSAAPARKKPSQNEASETMAAPSKKARLSNSTTLVRRVGNSNNPHPNPAAKSAHKATVSSMKSTLPLSPLGLL